MKSTFTLLVIIINSILFAQPEISWIKEYNTSDLNEAGFSVAETNDHDGYVICAYRNTPVNLQDLFLIRTDTVGDTVWTRQYGVPNGSDYGMQILKTGYGYIVGGMLVKPSISYWAAWLIKIDETGDSLWSKTILDSARIMSVCLTPDGGYAVTGTKVSGIHDKLFISRVDSSGNVLWLNFYGNYSDSYGVNIITTQDSGFAVIGAEYDSSFTNEKLWFLKTDDSGMIISDKLYDIRCSRGTIQQTFNGNFILGVETFREVSFIKISSDGEILDSLDYTGNECYYPGMSQTADSGFICMYTDPWYNDYSSVIRFEKLDRNFNKVWTKDISGNHDYSGMSFIMSGNNALVVTGYSNDFQTSGYSSILLAKLEGDITPVELIAFEGGIQGNNVILNWETATEINNYGFDIERSSGSNSWTNIGFVEGNISSTVPHTYSFIDSSRQSGVFYYRLKQIDLDGSFVYSKEIKVELSPFTFSLEQNYPNPFNPVTTIRYSIQAQANVKLEVSNILGQKVASLVNEVKSSGSYSVEFNAGNLASGIYIYQLTLGRNILTRKMLLLK